MNKAQLDAFFNAEAATLREGLEGEEREAFFVKWLELEHALIEIAALEKQRDTLRFSASDMAELERVEEKLSYLEEKKAALMGAPSESGKEGKEGKETKQTKAQQRQIELIERVRGLMQKEIGCGTWPSEKRGKEGLLKFIWRKHGLAIKRIYGTVECETIRRKTSPAECKKLGLSPLPK